MINFLRKTFTVFLALTLIFSFSSLSFAKNDKDKRSIFFKDTTNHWASESIETLSSLGLVAGFEDGTFQPNKPVTRVEAVAFVVKAMGYLNKESLETLKINLPYHDSNRIPLWAQASIQVALNHNIIQPSSGNFQPEKGATRLEVVSMIANALNEQNTLYNNLSIPFTDLQNLTKEDILNIKLSVSKGLVAGFKNNTFQPNKPVTRAEMAVFMHRLLHQNQNPVTSKIISATFVGINDEVIFVKPLNTTSTTSPTISYELSDEVKVYKVLTSGSKVSIDLEDIQLNDKLELVLNQDKEVTIITVLASEQIEELQGDVRFVDPATRQIRIRMVTNNTFTYNTYTVTNNALITKGSLNTLISLEDIEVSDKVLFRVNAENQIYKLHVTSEIVPVDQYGLQDIQSFTLIKTGLVAKYAVNSYGEIQLAQVQEGTVTYTGDAALTRIKNLVTLGNLTTSFDLNKIMTAYALQNQASYKVEFNHSTLGKMVLSKSSALNPVQFDVVKTNFVFNYEFTAQKEEIQLIDSAFDYQANVISTLNNGIAEDVLGVIQIKDQTTTFDENDEKLTDYINDIKNYMTSKKVVVNFFVK